DEGAKLVKTVEKLIGTVSVQAQQQGVGMGAKVKTRTYRKAELNEIRVTVPGMFFTPTYTYYKGWFVLSLYPQPVQGFVARMDGELPSWKPDGMLQKSLAKLPKEVISVSVTDPRPVITNILTIAPILASLARGFAPQLEFDVSMLPNANEVTRGLFPNV